MKRGLFIWAIAISLQALAPEIHSQSSFFGSIKEIEAELFIKKASLDTALLLMEGISTDDYFYQNWTDFCSDQLKLAEIGVLKGDFAYSMQLLKASNDSTNKYFRKDDPFFTEFYFRQGSVCLDVGFLSEAKKNFDSTTLVLSKYYCKSDTSFSKLNNKLGTYYYYMRDFDSAYYYYSQALNLVIKKRNAKKELNSVIQNLAIILTIKGKFKEAETLFLQSYRYSNELYEDQADKLSPINLNLGKFYFNVSDYKKASKYLNRAELLISKSITPNLIQLYGIYWNKGLNLFFLGETTLALTYLEKSLQTCQQLYPDYPEYQYPLIMDLAYCYEKAGKDSLAELYYNQCLNTKDNKLKIKVLKNLASLHKNEGREEKARECFSLAIHLNRSFYGKDSLTLAHTYLKYGQFLLNCGNSEGITYLIKAQKIYLEFGPNSYENLAIINNEIGGYFSRNNRLSTAVRYYANALELVAINYSRTSDYRKIESLPMQPLVTDMITDLALAYHQKYLDERAKADIIKAIESYELCYNHILRLLVFYKYDDTKLDFIRNSESLYEKAISACRLAFHATNDSAYLFKAFDFAERNKSMNLLISLKNETAKDIGNIPEDLSEKEREMKLSRNIFSQALSEEQKKPRPNADKIAYLNGKLLELESEYSTLTEVLEQEYPDYYRMKYDFTTAGVRQVQSLLSSDQMLLEYTFGKDTLFMFCLTKNRFDLLACPADTNMVRDIFALRENFRPLDILDYEKDDFHDFQRRSKRLYKLLVKPFDHFQEIRRVIVIPDDELGYLSFDMLAEDKYDEEEIRFSNMPFLVRKYSISYAPSATLLDYELCAAKDRPSRGLLGFAPVYSSQDLVEEGAGLPSLFHFADNLPGAVDEIRSIPGRYFGKKCYGKEATENNFKKFAGKFDILHLAMHTKLNDEYPLNSELQFYPVGDSAEDGLLHTYEIFNLKLKSRMVVLSACSSGSGKLEKGEGINSLARAFLYAGANSIVMTLWNVEDNASRKLISFYYDKISEGLPKDEALRQAKIEYLSEIRHVRAGHPFFWAGYVVYGNTDPIPYPAISFGRFKSEFPWFILGVIFVISLFLWRRKIRQKRRRRYAWRRSSILRILRTR